MFSWLIQAQENDFKLQNKTMMEEISQVNCYSNLCFNFLSLKLTDQRDLLNTELSQAAKMHKNVNNDEYRRLQAENVALRKSLGGRE